MKISSDDFRSVLRQFASGVTIVTIQAGGIRHGLTVSAFSSISTDPPLIMIAINNHNYASSLLQKADTSFAVNILADKSYPIALLGSRMKIALRWVNGQPPSLVPQS